MIAHMVLMLLLSDLTGWKKQDTTHFEVVSEPAESNVETSALSSRLESGSVPSSLPSNNWESRSCLNKGSDSLFAKAVTARVAMFSIARDLVANQGT